MTELLKVHDYFASYGQVPVLRAVNLTVKEGQIVAVIGSNGAGKSTLLKSLAGIVAATGATQFAGQDCMTWGSHQRVEQGMVLVPEGRLIFSEMTVRENLLIGAINPRARAKAKETMGQIFDLFPRLAERTGQLGGTLSGGEQQMLALGRGLMAKPRLLLLDEPTLGLAPGMATQIFQIIPRLAELQITTLLAEQDVQRTLRMADYAYVLENGQIGLQGTGSALIEDPAVKQAYLGV